MYQDIIGTSQDPAYKAEQYLEGLEYSQRTTQAAWIERYGDQAAEETELVTGPILKGFIHIEDLEDLADDPTADFELTDYQIKRLQGNTYEQRKARMLEDQADIRRFWATAAADHRVFKNSMRKKLFQVDSKEELYMLVDQAIKHDELMAKETGKSFWNSFSDLESAFLKAEASLKFKPVFVKVGTFIYRAENEHQLAEMVSYGGEVRG